MRYKDNRYKPWWSMQDRCYNEEHVHYENYGGRGITVCERWLDPVNGLSNFCSDMGPRPDGYSIDRIDGNGNYTPDNCKWSSSAEQQRNLRSTKIQFSEVKTVLKLLDSGKSQSSVAKMYGCHQTTVHHIFKNRNRYEATVARGAKASL